MKFKKKILSLWKSTQSHESDPQKECAPAFAAPSSSLSRSAEDDSSSLSAPRVPLLELCDLPNELLASIFAFACENQANYGTLLLTSKALHTIVETRCFGHFPIRLQTEAQTRSFDEFLSVRLDLRPEVRYLWMNGPRFEPLDDPPVGIPENSLPAAQYRIIERLTGLRSLVCPYHVFQHICQWTDAQPSNSRHYPNLREVEILDSCNQSWGTETYRLYNQITHLSLLEPCPQHTKPTHWKLFPNLQGFSFELHADDASSLLHTIKIHEEEGLREIPPSIQIAISMARTDSGQESRFELLGNHAYSIYCGKLRYYRRWVARLEPGRGFWYLTDV